MKLLSLILFFSLSLSQNKLDVFDNLVGGTWSIEEKFSNGEIFKQEVRFSWALDSTIILTQTKGTINRVTKEFGERNYGVRAWDEKQKRMRFWEFDVFGGITEGDIKIEGKSIIYTYHYGNSTLRESWIFKSKNSYAYKIVSLKDGNVDQVYLEGEFKRD